MTREPRIPRWLYGPAAAAGYCIALAFGAWALSIRWRMEVSR